MYTASLPVEGTRFEKYKSARNKALVMTIRNVMLLGIYDSSVMIFA